MSGDAATSIKPSKFKSLGVRAVSGVALILLCGYPVYYGGWATIFMVALFGVGMLWEWVKMTDVGFTKIAVGIPVIALLIVLALAGTQSWSLALCSIFAASLIAGLERYRRKGSLWAVFGIWYIILPCFAFVWLRGNVPGFNTSGFAKLVFVMVVVITADSFAYLGGATLKGPKLAPKISPNKTWSGFISGLIFSGLAGMLTAYFAGFNVWYGLLLAIPIALASVIGDLFESGLKRHLNVKDAGDVLPGHGGLLDRLDSLMFAVLVTTIAFLIWPELWPG